MFSRTQKFVALVYGVISLVLFATAVVVSILSLYRGLDGGLVRLHGPAALALAAVLVAQFAGGHSWLLSKPGRGFLSHLAPLGLGQALGTTIFTALAAAQLTATFALWPSSGVVWAEPHGALLWILTILYALSWLLLAKSMSDAGLDVQIGTIGWRSVLRDQLPSYPPFARTGLFRYSRQPIYSAFALILWTAPVWTPDHLFLAVVWTAYLLVAPLFKEQRYLRYYGDAFARYQRSVP